MGSYVTPQGTKVTCSEAVAQKLGWSKPAPAKKAASSKKSD